MDNFCSAIGCIGNHLHEEVTILNRYRYSVKEFYNIAHCYINERMNVCSFCKKYIDCKKVLNIMFFRDMINDINNKREDCINKVTVEYKCFNHKFCRICLETDGTTFVPFNYKNTKENWLSRKEKLGLIDLSI